MARPARVPEPEPFDLSEIVAEHIKRHKTPDPHKIAGEVLDEIPADKLYGVVELLLPDYIRERMDAHRRSVQKRKRSKKAKDNKSVKWAKTEHEDWDDIFFTSVSVPGVGRKWLGDCTRDDITGIIADYENLVASNQAKADSYSEVLALMKRRKVQAVSELPADLVIDAFTGDEEIEEEE